VNGCPAILGENTARFFSRQGFFRMTLRKSPVVILSEAKNLNSLRTHRELLMDAVRPCIGYKFYDMICNKFQKKGGEENGTDDIQREIYEPINREEG